MANIICKKLFFQVERKIVTETVLLLKLGYSEKGQKFKEIFHLKFDNTFTLHQILNGRFFFQFCVLLKLSKL